MTDCTTQTTTPPDRAPKISISFSQNIHPALWLPAMAATRPPARRGPSGAWNRLKPVPSDPLDAYGLPSKGETKLHDYKTQESYHSKIVERYVKFCAASGGGAELAAAFVSLALQPGPSQNHPVSQSLKRPPMPSAARTTATAASTAGPRAPNPDLATIWLAMRKLREGITGSRRSDGFAQRAYMFMIQATILTGSWESYQPALLYLLHDIHAATPLSAPELQEFVSYHVLDLACRQAELGQAMGVRRAFGPAAVNRRVDAMLRALIHDDWVRFWRVRRAVDGYQRAIIDHAQERMRLHALKCLGRSYMNADRAFIERSCDASWEDLVSSGCGWQLQDGGNVTIRRPKAKG